MTSGKMISPHKCIFFVISIIIFLSSCAYGDMSKNDIYWLSQNIYHEARGETLVGKVLVGMVTIERLNSGRWGKSIKSVVTANKQFSWYSDGKSDKCTDKKAWKEAKILALVSYNVYQEVDINGIMYYHNKTVQPYWADKMKKVVTIGNHIFYKK